MFLWLSGCWKLKSVGLNRGVAWYPKTLNRLAGISLFRSPQHPVNTGLVRLNGLPDRALDAVKIG